jgi:hypothetical protein
MFLRNVAIYQYTRRHNPERHHLETSMFTFNERLLSEGGLGNGGIALCIHNVDPSLMINITPRPLYSRGKNPGTDWVAG